ncbi:MAG: hypothetical protein M5U12_20610 [Verrucomicrobia bacterium]|nr:hypothetical protein [Verrucomicrobiota bacterium]
MNDSHSLPRRAFLEKAATLSAIGFAAPTWHPRPTPPPPPARGRTAGFTSA